jgi:hypothetical protein
MEEKVLLLFKNLRTINFEKVGLVKKKKNGIQRAATQNLLETSDSPKYLGQYKMLDRQLQRTFHKRTFNF